MLLLRGLIDHGSSWFRTRLPIKARTNASRSHNWIADSGNLRRVDRRCHSGLFRNRHSASARESRICNQDRLIAVVADSQRALQPSTSPGVVKPLQTSDPSASNPRSDVTRGFSVSNIHPTNGFVTAHATRPASSTQPDAPVSSTPPSQSRTAAEPHLVSVPTRKPKRPMPKEARSTAEPKAEPGTQAEAGPKPLAFGSIGYNYNPQQ